MEKVRYLCPICDHELLAKGYCPSCKKMINNPVAYRGGYLPNEDSGNYVLNRKFSNAGTYKTGSSYTQTPYTSNTRVSADYGDCGGHKDSDYGIPNVDPHSKKSSPNVKKIIKWIIIGYVVLNVLNAIFGLGD